MKKQQGFSLIGLLLTMSILSLMAVGAVHKLRDYRERTAAKQYVDRVIYLAERLQLYNYHKAKTDNVDPIYTWPNKLNDLMTDYDGAFWQQCSVAEQQTGKCLRPDSTPWNVPIKYEIITKSVRYVELTIPYGSTGDMIKRWSAPMMQQGKYPFTELPNGDVKITINYLTDAVVYQDFLKRDGSTTLTADWDVGNKAVLNAAAFSVRTQDGKQVRIDGGTVREFLAQHDDRVYKNSWSCPVALKPTIHVSLNAPMAPNQHIEYIGIANFKPYAIDKGSYYQLGLEYNAKIKATGKWKKMNSGYLNVRLNCSQ